MVMALTTAAKAQIIEAFKQSEQDTGSSDVQIALLTKRIEYLTEHLNAHKHDVHTRYGLTNMVSQRRRLMKYLKRKDFPRYQALIKALGIRG
jgi:small subunit ribosomal protein S15